jgi:hypothetical protein
MADTQRVEIGIAGGQVVSVRLEEDPLADLRKAVEKDSGWYDLETDDGTLALDLGKVVFVRIAGAPHTIGFSGD